MNSKRPDRHTSDEEWRQRLGADEYQVMRQKGTERPFTGEYCRTVTPGRYDCRACGEPLFDAATKFDAGCGWPSFYQPIRDGAIDEHRDLSHGMIRTEIVCHHCGAHLGHVFDDGPAPTGLRYCLNSLSLRLHPSEPDA